MPPKPKFTKEEIIENAFSIVAKKGIDALTARELGNSLGSSPRPIFTVFENMEEVCASVKAEAMKYFDGYTKKFDNDMPDFKQIGMKMVLFGIEEPKLYQLLFMEENKNVSSFEDVFKKLGKPAEDSINIICKDYDLSFEDAKKLFENMWIYTFGIGTLCATKTCCFSKEEISKMLTFQFEATINFLKS